jgi:hypothetical protein
MKDFFAEELGELWNDLVGRTPELAKKGGYLFQQPDADMSMAVSERKAEVEKVLAFKPVVDGFLDSQEDALEKYIDEHVDYLKGLVRDKIGSGIGTSRADIVMRLADELSLGADDPPPVLVALYVVKYGNRFKD